MKHTYTLQIFRTLVQNSLGNLNCSKVGQLTNALNKKSNKREALSKIWLQISIDGTFSSFGM
jgi:hypothetical protein